jgi:hypothetical protein
VQIGGIATWREQQSTRARARGFPSVSPTEIGHPGRGRTGVPDSRAHASAARPRKCAGGGGPAPGCLTSEPLPGSTGRARAGAADTSGRMCRRFALSAPRQRENGAPVARSSEHLANKRNRPSWCGKRRSGCNPLRCQTTQTSGLLLVKSRTSARRRSWTRQKSNQLFQR